MKYDIKFDPQNRNTVLIKQRDKLINFFAIPPTRNKFYMVSFGKEVKPHWSDISDCLLIFCYQNANVLTLNGSVLDTVNIN